MKILAGDIGGTNTRLIYADADTSNQQIQAEKYYPSSEYSSLLAVIERFYAEHHIDAGVDAACFAIAGPVKAGIATVTNLPWIVSERELSNHLDIPLVKIINDFTGVTYGISELNDTDFLIMQQGLLSDDSSYKPDAAVIGAGTGLGVSHRAWINGHYQAFSSEAGHAGFAPENELQCKLLSWLQKKYTHVSLETLLSGKGLYTIYTFLHEACELPESAAINHAMQNADPARIITASALSGTDDLCSRTVGCFVDIYGAAAGNVALHYFPIDEIYIAGGIASKIRQILSGPRFINAFVNKGPMTSNMEKITVKLITQEKVGLYGALSTARSIHTAYNKE